MTRAASIVLLHATILLEQNEFTDENAVVFLTDNLNHQPSTSSQSHTHPSLSFPRMTEEPTHVFYSFSSRNLQQLLETNMTPDSTVNERERTSEIKYTVIMHRINFTNITPKIFTS